MTDIRPSEQIDINMPLVQNPDRTWRKAEPHEKPQAYAIKQQEGESVVAITAEEKAVQDDLRVRIAKTPYDQIALDTEAINALASRLGIVDPKRQQAFRETYEAKLRDIERAEYRSDWEQADQRANEPSPWKEMSSAPKDRPIALLVDGKVTAGKWTYDGMSSGWWMVGHLFVSSKIPSKWAELPAAPTEGQVDIPGDPENYHIPREAAVEFFRRYAPNAWNSKNPNLNPGAHRDNLITEAVAMGQPRPAAEGAYRCLGPIQARERVAVVIPVPGSTARQMRTVYIERFRPFEGALVPAQYLKSETPGGAFRVMECPSPGSVFVGPDPSHDYAIII